jgi:fructose-1-phosphate kinase PfkB-like protein
METSQPNPIQLIYTITTLKKEPLQSGQQKKPTTIKQNNKESELLMLRKIKSLKDTKGNRFIYLGNKHTFLALLSLTTGDILEITKNGIHLCISREPVHCQPLETLWAQIL